MTPPDPTPTRDDLARLVADLEKEFADVIVVTRVVLDEAGHEVARFSRLVHRPREQE